MDYYRIVWSDELSIGNAEVDAQHKRLIELIGAIPEKANTHDPEILAEALKYAAAHFVCEESFMAEIQYPDIEHHVNEHKKLTRILLSYQKEYESGGADLYAFKQFMFRWVRDHIMDEDKKIGLFAQGNCENQYQQAHNQT